MGYMGAGERGKKLDNEIFICWRCAFCGVDKPHCIHVDQDASVTKCFKLVLEEHKLQAPDCVASARGGWESWITVDFLIRGVQ
jgi:hypothetical protein